MAKCNNCGKQLSPKSKYCPHCGERAGTAQAEPAPQRKKRKGLMIGLICGEIALLLIVSIVLVRYITAARPSSAIDASGYNGSAGDEAAQAGSFVYKGYSFGESDAGDIKAAKEMLANPVVYYPPQSIHVQWGSWMTQTNGNYTDLGGAAVSIGEGRIRDFIPSLDGEVLCYLAYTQPGSEEWERSGMPDGELPSLFLGQSGGAQTEVAQNVIAFSFLPHNRALAYSRSEGDQVLLCTFLEGKEKVLAQGKIGEFCLSANRRYVLYLQDNSALYVAPLTGEAPVRAQSSDAERPCAISNDGRCIWYFRAAEHPVLVCQTLDGKESTDVYETQGGMRTTSAELYFNYSATEAIILDFTLDETHWVSSMFVYRPSAGLTQCSDTSSDIVVPQGTQLSYSFGKKIHQLLAEDFSTFFYVSELADYDIAENVFNLHYGMYLYAEGRSQPLVEHFAIGQSADGPASNFYPFVNQDGTTVITTEDNTLYRIPVENGNVGTPQVIDVPVWGWQASIDGNTIYYCTGEDTEGNGWPILSTLYRWQNGQSPTMVADDVDTDSFVISADGSKCAFISFNQMFYCEAGEFPSTIIAFEEAVSTYSIALSNDGGLLYVGLVSRDGPEPQVMQYGIYYYQDGQSTLLIDKNGYEL